MKEEPVSAVVKEVETRKDRKRDPMTKKEEKRTDNKEERWRRIKKEKEI